MNYDLNDPTHFLNSLPLSNEDKKKLGDLAPKSAFELLARRQAAKASFDAYLGADRADAIANVLGTLLSDDERQKLAEPVTAAPGRLGARTGKP